MENNKTKRKVIAPNFGKHPELALKLLADEKSARDTMRKKHEENERDCIDSTYELSHPLAIINENYHLKG